ncbi:MAG: phospho-sugar mutase [Halobacteriovoraceae bacterium]|nr:phospho-sugar mutase [Halobacteriovoraceae bacterium]
MEGKALDLARAWGNNSHFDENSRKEIQDLIDNNDTKEIIERFYKNLEFGTGGMRSILGAGNNRINKYNIRKASQAVATEVLATGESQLCVSISYDSRHFSFEFAKEAASVFAANGITAHIYKRLNPVALVSFAIRHFKCQAGVMVTASHNPPDNNGYKVFWRDGAQVTPPYDKNIIGNFNKITDYSSIKFMDFDKGVQDGLIHWIGEDIENLYYEAIYKWVVNPEMCQQNGEKLKIVYTPIHGTGLIPCVRALKDLGLENVEVVPEQAQPDSDFPTVSSPNPENPEALALAVDLMKKSGADIALGSDPDTDRLGVALQHEGETVYLNGNQIGIIMLHYILTNWKEQGKIPKNPYFVKTIVTTPLQEKIAKHFGIEVENTLTGFKWICGRMREIEQNEPERNFVFATEESFGYLNHDSIRDKDGVSSITLISELALWYKLQGFNLVEALDKIYDEYGFSHETLLNIVYQGKEGSEKIGRIMSNFRKYSDKRIFDQDIHLLEDYQEHTIRYYQENKTESLDLPTSNVLGYHLSSGDRVYLRPSGTEPKIKFYIMVQETEGSLVDKKARALAKTEKILEYLKSEAEKA